MTNFDSSRIPDLPHAGQPSKRKSWAITIAVMLLLVSGGSIWYYTNAGSVPGAGSFESDGAMSDLRFWIEREKVVLLSPDIAIRYDDQAPRTFTPRVQALSTPNLTSKDLRARGLARLIHGMHHDAIEDLLSAPLGDWSEEDRDGFVADAHFFAGEYELAAARYRKLIQPVAFSPIDANALGVCLARTKDGSRQDTLRAAQTPFQQVVDYCNPRPRMHRLHRAVALWNLAMVQEALGSLSDAETNFVEASRAFAAYYRVDHPVVTAASEHIARVRKSLGTR